MVLSDCPDSVYIQLVPMFLGNRLFYSQMHVLSYLLGYVCYISTLPYILCYGLVSSVLWFSILCVMV